MPGHAIIIGTGQIGIACAAHLAEQGWTVATIGRSLAPPELFRTSHCIADRTDSDQLQNAVGEGADLLIDTIAFDAPDALQLTSLRDRLGAIAVISSASIYCDSDGRTLDEAVVNGFPVGMTDMAEDWPTVPPGPATYSTRKVAMEQALIEGAGDKAIIIRPCAIHGPYSRHPREWWFVKRMLDGRRKIPLVNNGESRFQTTGVASIARLIADVAATNSRGFFNCADADSPSVMEIGGKVAALLQPDVEFVGVPGANGIVGRTPWSVPLPFATSNAKAIALGVGRFDAYALSAERSIKWLSEFATHDWEHRFAALAAYPWNLFDYSAEDSWLDQAKAE
jgi:nucleoside-diphosphate-sugar epimerase